MKGIIYFYTGILMKQVDLQAFVISGMSEKIFISSWYELFMSKFQYVYVVFGNLVRENTRFYSGFIEEKFRDTQYHAHIHTTY